jgi:putative membrane protein
MSQMKRIITFALILLVSLLGLTFALMNAETVQLNYYFGNLQAPLSLVVVIAIIIGAGLGVLASMGIVLGQKRELAKLRKSARLAEQEVSNLRSLPLKDNH